MVKRFVFGRSRGLFFASVWLIIGLLTAVDTAASDLRDPQIMTGYVMAILEQQLGWSRQDYTLDVRNGRVSITLSTEDPLLRETVLGALKQVSALEGLAIDVALAEPSISEQAPGPIGLLRGFWAGAGLTSKTTRFPPGDLFRPLVADPKQPRFFISIRRYDTDVETIASAAVGYGETFGLVQYEGVRAGDGLQVGIDGALFAQFNLDEDSKDLVNADYSIGVPMTYRQGPYSARLRLYHQSSHLGDEFLLRARPERINLSFEALELLGSLEGSRWRGYLGGEYLIHREPEDLDRAMLHGGVEYRGTRPWLGLGFPVAGLDLKSFEEHDWSVDAGLSVGLHAGDSVSAERYLRVMAEGYKGFAPHGQFYKDRISYLGVSISFGL